MKHKERAQGRSPESQPAPVDDGRTSPNNEASRASLKLAGSFGLVLLLIILAEVLLHGTG